MDQALEDDKGGRVRFGDEAAAMHFRARCHQARKIHRAKNAEIYPEPDHPQHGASHYDELILRLRPDGDGCYVYMERLRAGSIEVEPLSEAPAIEYHPPRQLPAPDAMPKLVETIVKRRI